MWKHDINVEAEAGRPALNKCLNVDVQPVAANLTVCHLTAP
jgi:hypothetical protein